MRDCVVYVQEQIKANAAGALLIKRRLQTGYFFNIMYLIMNK